MRISASTVAAMREANAVVVGVHKEVRTAALPSIDSRVDNRLNHKPGGMLKDFPSFDGTLGDVLYGTGDTRFPGTIVLVGLGEKDKYDLAALRKFVSAGVKAAASAPIKASYINLVVPFPTTGETTHVYSIQAATEAAKLSTYEFLHCKSDPKPKYDISGLTIVHDESQVVAENGIRLGEISANAQNYARYLVNLPAADLTPADLADRAIEVAKANGLGYEIFDQRKIRQHKMGGVLAVSAGSNKEPRFIVIRYRPEGAKEHLALVGKGVTFDSGGLSIKPTDSMMDMKGDMGGAAAVIAVMSAITQLNPDINVTAVIPSVENMLGSGAYKLGDVVTFMGGQRAEIRNTDAEGRVILGDALHWAVDEKCEDANTVFDYATLTGACMVALGEHITGLITNNDALAERVIKASKHTGEKMWQLPLDDELRKKIDGDVGDFNNLGINRYGGASTAAAFLEKFVQGKSWVHHDIAGPAWAEKPNALGPAGGTGVPVRTMLHFLGYRLS